MADSSSDTFVNQRNEFDAADELCRALASLPAIVDDDYPAARHHYESALHNLFEAMLINDRFVPNSRGALYLLRAGWARPRQHPSLDFASLRISNITRQAEWDDKSQISSTYRGNELGGEIGEVMEEAIDFLVSVLRAGKATGKLQNVLKKLERERLGIRGSRATKESLSDELSDGVICLDLIAMQEGIDLGDAVKKKFNATSEKVGLKTRIL